MSRKLDGPDLKSLSQHDKKALISRVRSNSLNEKDRELVVGIIDAVAWLSKMLERKRLSMIKIKRLFGFQSERKKDVIKPNNSEKEPEVETSKNDDEDDTSGGSCTNATGQKESPVNPKPKGHGRMASSSYENAETEFHAHESLKAKDSCPECNQGKLYDLDPGTLIKIYGQEPFKAVNHRVQRLRCSFCGVVYKAKLPDSVPAGKLDDKARSILSIFRYRMGIPHYRLAKLQKFFGVPLPPSTQWDEIEKTINSEGAVFKELQKTAALSDLFYKDDTTGRILELKKSLKDQDDQRQGIYTSAIVSVLENKTKIALFFTANRHAADNLRKVMEFRRSGLDRPLVMCDALSSNTKVSDIAYIIHCLDHARRQFVDIATSFPKECEYILNELGKVYSHDKVCKTLDLDDWERMAFHLTHTKPVMDHLSIWLEQKLASGEFEENSSLGEAALYMLRRWDSFCGCYQFVGAPLSNAKCERLVKTTKPHYKNSLFYKTMFGAIVGDIKMSLIQTCEYASKNPLRYLTALQTYAEQVMKNPSAWLPWNYEETLAGVQ